MSELKENIIRLLVFVAAVVLCSFIISLFQKQPKKDTSIELIMKLNDSLVASIKRERDAVREAKDEITKLLLQKDTVLIREYKTNTVKYEKIPVVVGNLSDDELRRAVEEFR